MKNYFNQTGTTSEIAMVLFGTIALLPFLLLSFYNHPLGVHEWDWITNRRGAMDNLSFYQEQKFYYFNASGRFASTWISSLTDNYYSLINFQSFFAINILLSVLIIFIAVRSFLNIKSFFKSFAISILICSIWISGISSIYDTLYMLTSVHTYLFGFYSFILLLVCWKSFMYNTSKQIWYWPWLIVFISVFTIGTNEVSLFYTVFLNIFLVTYHYKEVKKRSVLSLILIISITAAIFSLLAPANFLRESAYQNDYSFIDLFFIAICSSLFDCMSWIINGHLMLGSIVYLLLIQNISIKNKTNISWQYFFSSLLIIIFLGHFLIIFATHGSSLAERVVDLMYFHFLMLWFYGLFLISIQYKSILNAISSFSFKNELSFIVIFCFFISLMGNGLGIDRNNKTYDNFISLIKVSSNVGKAWLTLLSGNAGAYDKAMNLQYDEIGSCRNGTCITKKPDILPIELYFEASDRRNSIKGDPFIGHYFNENIQFVKYIK